MTQFRSDVARLSVLALTAAVAAGCGTVSPDGTGNVQVTIQKIASATATQALADGFASAADGSYVPIDLDNVQSFTVQITSIEFLPVTADEENDAAWIRLPLDPAVALDPAVTLDLLALPTGGDSPIVIAAGPVDEGAYSMVRLLVSGGTIVFDTDFSVGQFTFDMAPDDHPVTIPSGVQTGLKTDLAFTVGEGGGTEVSLLFDEGATFQNATATGSGKVILTPVLRTLGGEGGT